MRTRNLGLLATLAVVLVIAFVSHRSGDASGHAQRVGLSSGSRELQNDSAEDLSEALPVFASEPEELDIRKVSEGRVDLGRSVEGPRTARVAGRVLRGPKPAPLSRLTLWRVEPAKSSRLRSAAAKSSKRLPKSKLNLLESFPTKISDTEGLFSFVGLPAGSYLIKAQDQAEEHVQIVSFDLEEGELYQLDDILLFRRTNKNTRKLDPSKPITAKLRVRCEQPGLHVVVHQEHSPVRGKDMGVTGSDGERVIEVEMLDPVRIDLKSDEGYLLGSTHGFQLYPTGLETLVTIHAAFGGLKLQLPHGNGVQPGQAMQYMVTGENTSKPLEFIETVRGTRPDRQVRGFKSTADHIEFQTLPPAQYKVEALRMTLADNGRWYPTGERWYGSGHVTGGELTVCQLN